MRRATLRMKQVLRTFDLALSLTISVLVTIVALPFVGLVRLIMIRRLRSGRPIVVSLTRMSDTSVEHLRLNSRIYLDSFFHRPGTDFVIVLCVGDGKPRVTRFGKRVVAVDVWLPSLPFLDKLIPRTLRVLRDIMALAVTGSFLLARNAAVLETMAPSQLMWRGTLLKWALDPFLITQVRGNLDLICAAGTPVRGSPLRQILAMFAVMRLKFLAQVYFRSCDLVIGFNVNNMENAISNGSHPAKTFLSRIRIDRALLLHSERSKAASEFMPADGPIIMLWSRLAPEKMVTEALDIVLRVLVYCPSASFVVIGDGELRQEMETRAAASPFASKVVFAGYRTRPEIAAAAHGAAMAIVPYGGSSLVEAGLLGLPTAAFDIEWHRELVRDGETGWLLDWRLPDVAASVLAQALGDRMEAIARAARFKSATVTMFDEATIERREHDILASILGSIDSATPTSED